MPPRAQVSNCHFLSPFHPGNRLRSLAPTHPGPPEAPRFASKAAHGRSQKEVSPSLPHSYGSVSLFSWEGFSFISLCSSGLLSLKIQLADIKKKHTITKHTLYCL